MFVWRHQSNLKIKYIFHSLDDAYVDSIQMFVKHLGIKFIVGFC